LGPNSTKPKSNSSGGSGNEGGLPPSTSTETPTTTTVAAAEGGRGRGQKPAEFGQRFEADVGYVDVDTRVSRESYAAATMAAGAVILAVSGVSGSERAS